MMSRKLQIFKFMLIEMFSPCFLNSRVMSFLVRSDFDPFGALTKPGSDSGLDRIESDWYLRVRGRFIIRRKAVLKAHIHPRVIAVVCFYFEYLYCLNA